MIFLPIFFGKAKRHNLKSDEESKMTSLLATISIGSCIALYKIHNSTKEQEKLELSRVKTQISEKSRNIVKKMVEASSDNFNIINKLSEDNKKILEFFQDYSQEQELQKEAIAIQEVKIKEIHNKLSSLKNQSFDMRANDFDAKKAFKSSNVNNSRSVIEKTPSTFPVEILKFFIKPSSQKKIIFAANGPGCGKSTMLSVIQCLAFQDEMVVNIISNALIIKKYSENSHPCIDREKLTLTLDEIQKNLDKNKITLLVIDDGDNALLEDQNPNLKANIDIIKEITSRNLNVVNLIVITNNPEKMLDFKNNSAISDRIHNTSAGKQDLLFLDSAQKYFLFIIFLRKLHLQFVDNQALTAEEIKNINNLSWQKHIQEIFDVFFKETASKLPASFNISYRQLKNQVLSTMKSTSKNVMRDFTKSLEAEIVRKMSFLNIKLIELKYTKDQINKIINLYIKTFSNDSEKINMKKFIRHLKDEISSKYDANNNINDDSSSEGCIMNITESFDESINTEKNSPLPERINGHHRALTNDHQINGSLLSERANYYKEKCEQNNDEIPTSVKRSLTRSSTVPKNLQVNFEILAKKPESNENKMLSAIEKKPLSSYLLSQEFLNIDKDTESILKIFAEFENMFFIAKINSCNDKLLKDYMKALIFSSLKLIKAKTELLGDYKPNVSEKIIIFISKILFPLEDFSSYKNLQSFTKLKIEDFKKLLSEFFEKL